MPRTGPCAPWIAGDDVAQLGSVQKAIEALKTNVPDPGTVASLCAEAAAAAAHILYILSGSQFTGECGPVTVRPVQHPPDIDTRARVSSGYGTGWNGGYSSGYGSAFTGPTGAWATYGPKPSEITLGAFPVTSIVSVLIDGVTIPADEYYLQDYRTLVRVRTSSSATPTEMVGFPYYNNLSLPDTEPGTMSVTFMYGVAPPPSGMIAVRKLAEVLVLPQFGDTTRTPDRVTSITRQGITTQVASVIDLMKNGSSGLYECDIFLNATNPNRNRRPPAIFSPDTARPRRNPSGVS